VPLDKGVQEVGLFGNQNPVCKPTTPKWRHTIERLKLRFPKLRWITVTHAKCVPSDGRAIATALNTRASARRRAARGTTSTAGTCYGGSWWVEAGADAERQHNRVPSRGVAARALASAQARKGTAERSVPGLRGAIGAARAEARRPASVTGRARARLSPRKAARRGGSAG
jgi:hypothetical protein